MSIFLSFRIKKFIFFIYYYFTQKQSGKNLDLSLTEKKEKLG